jgi:lysophospholipase L1-like esterase
MDGKVKKICDDKTVPTIDFSNSDFFNNHRLLFHDVSHLNDSGARIFTKMLVDSIKVRMGH